MRCVLLCSLLACVLGHAVLRDPTPLNTNPTTAQPCGAAIPTNAVPAVTWKAGSTVCTPIYSLSLLFIHKHNTNSIRHNTIEHKQILITFHKFSLPTHIYTFFPHHLSIPLSPLFSSLPLFFSLPLPLSTSSNLSCRSTFNSNWLHQMEATQLQDTWTEMEVPTLIPPILSSLVPWMQGSKCTAMTSQSLLPSSAILSAPSGYEREGEREGEGEDADMVVVGGD